MTTTHLQRIVSDLRDVITRFIFLRQKGSFRKKWSQQNGLNQDARMLKTSLAVVQCRRSILRYEAPDFFPATLAPENPTNIQSY